MLETIYIVFGQTGEYSDHYEWVVGAYLSEAQAQQHVQQAQRRANEIEATRSSRFCLDGAKSEYDDNIGMDYTGTSYYYAETEIFKSVEDYVEFYKKDTNE